MADEKSFSDSSEDLQDELEATERIEKNRNDNATLSNPERRGDCIGINHPIDCYRNVSTSSYSRETSIGSNSSPQFNIPSYGRSHSTSASLSIATTQPSSSGASEKSRASSSRVPIAAPRGIVHRTDNNHSNLPSQNCFETRIWRPWLEMELQNANFGPDVNRCRQEENSASKFFLEQNLMSSELPIEREESGAAPQTAEDGRQLSSTSALLPPTEDVSSIERTTDTASVASLTGSEAAYANPKGQSSGHLNENNGDSCPSAPESNIEKSNETTSLIANSKQISLLPSPGRKRKYSISSTLEFLPGGMNKRHSDSEPSPSSHEERSGNEAAENKSKKGSKLGSLSAQVLPGGFSSRIEMSPDSSALCSGSSSDASAVSVAGPSGTQARSKKTEKEGSFVCDVCNKAFAYRGPFQTHYRTHTGAKPFECGFCGKGFSQQGNLTTHLLTHTGERRFPCEVCGKGFNRKHHLEEHLRIHTGEKPYVCEICGRGFTQQNHLQNHLPSHSGENPYKCRWCGKEYLYRSSYKRHLKHVHGQE